MGIRIGRVVQRPGATVPAVELAGERLKPVQGRGQRRGRVIRHPEAHARLRRLDRLHLCQGADADS